MNKVQLLNEGLPLVTEYNDLYENADIAEVIAKANEDDPIALYELAYRYRSGEGGVQKDELKAYECYKRVLKHQRNTTAMYRLGFACVCGVFGEGEKQDSVTYFEAAVELGDADSAVQLGLIYESGELVEQNYNKALELFMFAIDHGRLDAYVYAGEIYRHMNMIEKSVEYYNIALSNGELQAALPLGWYYEDGTGVEQDEKKAFELYKQSYEDGNPDSIYYLARMYYLGKGTEENDAEAYKLFKEASDQGYLDANCFLGSMYGYGVEGVVEKNVDLALEYLSNVSELFQVNAWYTKGCIYANEGKKGEALTWLTKAADAGDENAKKVIAQIGESNRTLQQMAEEDNNPGAMIKYAMEIMGDTSKGGITKSVELIRKAHKLYPDDLQVTEFYVRIMFIYGHSGGKIGDFEGAYNTLRDVVREIDILKGQNYKPSEIRGLEIDACFEYGELAYKRDDNALASSMLDRTDIQKYPYAAVLKAIIHFGMLGPYADRVANDISEIHSILGNSKWREPREEASAYYVLSVIYAMGVPGKVQTNVPYAYECIQKCATIDRELAAPELRKYSKGLLGKITYKN